MNWILAAAAPLIVAGVVAASGRIPAAILAYHGLCAATVYSRRSRIRRLLDRERWSPRWTIVTTLLVVGFLLAAPIFQDPRPFRSLFLETLFPGGDPKQLFAIFAVYTLIVHAPLEELFWRAGVLDPERVSLQAAVPANALFFYLLHAIPMSLIVGPRGWAFAGSTLLAGALWTFVTIRRRSIWPALVSHWAADAVLLGQMWFFFIR